VTFAAAESGVTAHVFVDSLDDALTVVGPDGHHLQRVRRVETGEHLTAADGTGWWRRYEVVRAGDRLLDLRSVAPVVLEPEITPCVTSAVALIARAKFESVAAQLSELGVAALVPVRTERCVVHWKADKAVAARVRLQVIAREAAMQCRRARVMQIHEVVAFDSLASSPGLLVADARGADLGDPAPAGGVSPEPDCCTLLSGPEGGLSDRERAALVGFGAPHVCLGPHVLRAETAAVAFAAVVLQRRR
jgi:16S rRNA (uracil1498-N3)-methyltransferase